MAAEDMQMRPRPPGWEARYVATLERHLAAPFAWGESDCLVVVADVAEALTGHNPLPPKSRRYRSDLAAMKQLRRRGFETIGAALAAHFARIPTVQARRGDCGVVEQMVGGRRQQAAVIVMGAIAVGKGPEGPIHVPLSRLKAVFAIGGR